MSDVTLLRKLTRKSLLKYGWHRDKCVQELLDNDPLILIRDYFRLSSTTFVDEILDELGIQTEERIEKPGKLTYVETKIIIGVILSRRNKKIREERGEQTYMRQSMHAKKVRKIARAKIASKNIFNNSRSADQLRRKNHGHRD